MEKQPLKEYPCRYFKFLRCGKPILRVNSGDALDFPFCEECQSKEGEITRLDNGEHT